MTAERGFTDRFFYLNKAQQSAGQTREVADAILFGNSVEDVLRLALPDVWLNRPAADFVQSSEVGQNADVESLTESIPADAEIAPSVELTNFAVEKPLTLDIHAVMTFEDWLANAEQPDSFSAKKEGGSDSDDLKILDRQIQLEIPFHMVSNILEKETHYAGDLSQFLQTEKQKKRPVRRRSKEQEGKVVTETMARVFVAQGNVEGAIDVFNRLILKNPSKKGIFEAEIEKLKTQR